MRANVPAASIAALSGESNSAEVPTPSANHGDPWTGLPARELTAPVSTSTSRKMEDPESVCAGTKEGRAVPRRCIHILKFSSLLCTLTTTAV
jgi:hypothetical protein